MSTPPTPPKVSIPKHARVVIIVGWEQGQAALTLGQPRAQAVVRYPRNASRVKINKLIADGARAALQELTATEHSLPLRVMAVCSSSAEHKKVVVFGAGWYIGDYIPDESCMGEGPLMHQRKVVSPKILLDGGSVIYGCECHYMTPNIFDQRFAGFELVPVSIDDMRAEAKARTSPPPRLIEAGATVKLRGALPNLPERTQGVVKEVQGEQEAFIVEFTHGGSTVVENLHWNQIELVEEVAGS